MCVCVCEKVCARGWAFSLLLIRNKLIHRGNPLTVLTLTSPSLPLSCVLPCSFARRTNGVESFCLLCMLHNIAGIFDSGCAVCHAPAGFARCVRVMVLIGAHI